MVFISGSLVFSQKNNAAVSQSKAGSRWQCSDHVMNRTNYFPEVLAFRGWTFFCAGGQEEVSGRHHCLQPGNILQLALGNQPKNLVFDRDNLYSREIWVQFRNPPFPGGLQRLNIVCIIMHRLWKQHSIPFLTLGLTLKNKIKKKNTRCMHYIHIRSSDLFLSALDYSLHCFSMSSLGQCITF